MLEESFYLGDGAYIRQGDYSGEVVIFTHNGIHPTNSVFLGPVEVEALLAWIQKSKQHVGAN